MLLLGQVRYGPIHHGLATKRALVTLIMAVQWQRERHEIAQRTFVLKRVREKQKMVHQANFQEASNLVGKIQ